MNLVVWWTTAGRAFACEGDLAAFEAVLQDADRALSALDSGSFEASVDRAREILVCLREPLTPELAAHLHRAVGLRAFAAHGPIAPGAFAAARRIEPDRALPSSLFPPESPVSEAWSAVSLDGLRLRALPEPSRGWLVLDGARGVDRALDLPVVFQRVAPDGSVVDAAYLLPGEDVPSYAAASGPAGSPPVSRSRGNGQRTTFAVLAGASGAAAAGAWALAVHGRSRFLDLDRPVPDDRLDGLQARTNALAVTGTLGAGLCAASGALLAATW